MAPHQLVLVYLSVDEFLYGHPVIIQNFHVSSNTYVCVFCTQNVVYLCDAHRRSQTRLDLSEMYDTRYTDNF